MRTRTGEDEELPANVVGESVGTGARADLGGKESDVPEGHLKQNLVVSWCEEGERERRTGANL